ncbi:hypothetical protein FRACYDRAFT_241189 [Fragilariopsis cylindrus CCMP1102]|uniref:Uncharacterized protein n=1 Tax=Fragilariopsis cylindrus CCMP1102 TaxID=635003 RepID=A0A1E7F910_9STRA|nr:hypothetical protein FRACYDRAFT_241189 [Fragilariopsis cylindrus CCMP1102]|eukprot:OEU14636.1 hypothetical protein FRACYDRAFT_241189 [Fragilariopsis cylindrus CCMP1102]
MELVGKKKSRTPLTKNKCSSIPVQDYNHHRTNQLNVNAQSELCSTYINSCNGCLENSCAWVPVAGCVESCDVIGTDVSCYSSEDFTGITTEEICSKYMAMEASNIKLCHSQTDCTTCIDTTFADGGFDGTTNSCKWFHFDCCIESYCGHECGGMGCGAFTCDAVANVDDNDNNDPIIKNSECDSNMSCRNCLSTRQIGPTACGWANGMGCVESCSNLIADVGGCYDIENFNGNGVVMTGDDICTVAENDLCSSQTDCTTCIETSRLGSSSYLDPYINTATAAAMKCRWFSNMNVCGSECNMIGCGETTCTAADSYNIGGDDDGDEEEKGDKEELQQQQQLTSVRRVRIMIDHDKKKKKRGQSIKENILLRSSHNFLK